MTMVINDECINCSACAVECPAEAIYEPKERYKTDKKFHSAISNEHYFIVTEICNECEGLEVVRCINVCPMDAIKEI